MTTQEKIKKLKSFKDESDFREFLIDFLKKRGFKNVLHTHRYGSPEKGKDIIAKYEHPIEGDEWYAFVVKKGRISGGTSNIETIKNQIKQAFEYPYAGPNGKQIYINKVKVVTNENFTHGAQDVLNQSPALKLVHNYDFWWNEKLIPLIDNCYADFWLPGDIFIKEYSKSLRQQINNEIEIRDLSIRTIDDKQLQKLLDIFIKPRLTTKDLEYDLKEKKKVYKSKKISISYFENVEENILLSGEQGSGKTRLLNAIASNLTKSKELQRRKVIPIKLKATDIVNFEYDLDTIIESEAKKLTDEFYNKEILDKYGKILLVDDLDLLKQKNKDKLVDSISKYCEENDYNFILTHRKSDYEFSNKVKKVTIENFNSNQVESFIEKYFEGSGKGKRFIRILRDSDLLSRLPTTPLTITLISLLYDENNYEIPATLSDIYTDFTSVLLGKLDVKNRADLLEFNMKRRLFSALALEMLANKKFEISFEDFKIFINNFLEERGYEQQLDEELIEIIERSGLLYLDTNNRVGFKQNAFVEFMASLEIYHHSREKHYDKLIENFNDVNWQNTAIFYAGHSKELVGMIDHVVSKSPNKDLKDWFINTGGMGYLSQALYQTKPSERVKLVLKSLDNCLKSYYELKELSRNKDDYFYNVPLPLILSIVAFWFTENFKSVTLKATLKQAFASLSQEENNFENNYKLLIIATTLMNPYTDDDSCFAELIENQKFMDHPILPIVTDMILDIGMIEKNKVDAEFKSKIENEIKKKKRYIKAVIKKPAYRFSNVDFSLEEK